MAFCHDVKNIIDNLVHQYRLCGLNKEYRQVFRFVDTIYDYKCPNPHGRCVAIFRDAKVHWFNGKNHRMGISTLRN